MASSYTTSLKIQEIGNGEQSGVWGTTTNTNWTLIEQAVAGVQTITMANSNYTLTNLNGVSDEARNMVLVVQGTNSGIYQIVAPLNQPKMYVVSNQTSGGYAITIGASSGSVITIPNGVTAQVYTDGTNFYSAQTGSAGNFNVNGTLTASGVTDTGSLSAASLSVSGTSTFTGIPSGPTATTGTNTTQLATTAFVNSSIAANPSVLTGSLLMWPTASAPSGYLNCDGSAVSRTTYSALYAVVGTTFGTGDGSTTFNLPNYQDRMPIGKGTIAASIGATGGSATTTISQANLPNVSFPVTDPGHQHNTSVTGSLLFPATGATTISYGGPGTYPATRFTMDNNTTGITVNSGGSGTAATTISPYLGINFIIKT
jgi:microcystin-dependent protein